MRVLHLLASGKLGGIENLCKNIALKSDFDNRLCFIFAEGSVYEELVKNKAKVISLKKKEYQLFSIVKEITNYCKKEKIDIINMHHGGMYCNIIYILLKKYNPNIKFVRFLHGCFDNYTYGNNNNKINNFLVKKVMSKALKISDLIISVSKAVEMSFENNFNLENNNKVVIYNGIGYEYFDKEIKVRDPFEGRTVRIIFVGRLVKVKGIDILIDAVNQLIQDGYDISLTIVGDGTEKKDLESKVLQENLQNNIKFVGAQTNVIKWLDESDIFVYPSIWEEAFGISVVEAMSRGCIPITFNKGGLPEIICNEKNGFMANEPNAKSLSETLKKVILNKNKKEIQDKAMETSRTFTIENTISKLKGEYIKIKKEGNIYDK